MTSATMREIPVLIVGAGPTGLMLALELSLHSIPFLLIDALINPSPTSRAIVMRERTLELLSRYPGLVERCIERGRMNTGMSLFANGKFVFEIDSFEAGSKDTRFPTPLMISQFDTEEVFAEELKRRYAGVERGVRAVKVHECEDGSGVLVVLKRKQTSTKKKETTCDSEQNSEDDSEEDGIEEVVKCQYVVGCDGAHSIVRKSSGHKFKGEAYPQDFILADLKMKWEHRDCLTLFIGGYGFMACFPLKDGVWRLICSRTHEINSDTKPEMKDFEETCNQLIPGRVELSDPLWISRFRLHHRIVENYRVAKRCFVAGDAAHIHSPAGGQGMNTGIQDVVNLAWKLAAVIKGEKEESFLDSYHGERKKIGQNLLKGTDRLFEFMASHNWIYLWFRNILVPWIAPWVMGNKMKRQHFFRFLSELGIRYRSSEIVGHAQAWNGSHVKAGDRMPDGKLGAVDAEVWLQQLVSKPIHHLILFSGVGAEGQDISVLRTAEVDFVNDGTENLKIHTVVHSSQPAASYYSDDGGLVHELFGFKEAGFVLVRPDGHVSYIGPLTALDELEAWMRK